MCSEVKLNKFEHVHVWRWGQGQVEGEGPCMMRSKVSWIMVKWDPTLEKQTDTIEKSKFPQFR